MAEDPRIGTTIAGYRVESAVGRGGMGVVYLAEQVTLGRKVALKVLAPELAADDRFRQRFLRESRIAASLEDPNILPIYEAGESEGLLFIAMRYVEGTDLKALIETEGALPAERVVAIVSQVASALDAAHERGLVHRDVKPANILLVSPPGGSHADKVYLADFGLTKRATSDSGITGTGQFVGTLDYAAPEQFTGEPLSSQTDVYSLGCVLYECLTGEAPFPRDREAAVLHAHLNEPPPPVTLKRIELPNGIDLVVAKAMNKERNSRYESAGALATAVEGALEVPVVARGARRSTKRPAMLVVALAGGIAALVGILAAIFLSRGDGSGVPGPIPASGPSRAIHFANGVAEIDPKTGAIGKRVATSGSPGVLPTIVSGEGAVWITQTSNVLRVNPRTGRARAVSVGSYVFDVAVGQGAMWACASAGLFRIDPATEKVVDQIQIRFNLGIGGCYVIASPGAAWVATQPGVIVRVDTGSDRAGQPRKVASSILAMTYGFHALWVLDDAEGVVVKLDPRTGKPIGRFAVGGNPRTMAVGLGSIWVGDSTGTVSKIDPESGAVTGPIRVGAGPTSISTGFGKVWVANRDDETISRIDPVTNDVSEIPVNAPIAAVTVDSQSHKLWVAVG